LYGGPGTGTPIQTEDRDNMPENKIAPTATTAQQKQQQQNKKNSSSSSASHPQQRLCP
jgi:hypothetical protein